MPSPTDQVCRYERGSRGRWRRHRASATRITRSLDPIADRLRTLALLAGRRLAALAPGRLLLRGRAALRGAALRARGMRLLAAVLRRVGRVRDLRRALLRHPLLLQRLVLLLVLHVRALARHHGLLVVALHRENAPRRGAV